MKISVCEYNEGIKEVIEAIGNEYPECIVTINKCIGACDRCGYTLIARIDGKLVEAESCEKLLDIIGEFIKAE